MANPAHKIDLSLATRLVAARFPDFAALPLAPLDTPGTDNTLFRLGERACLRLPRLPAADGQLVKEAEWLPQFSAMPLELPKPLALTGPFGDFPFHAAVYQWLPGKSALDTPPTDMSEAAKSLGGFVAALRRQPTLTAPVAGAHNQYRGAPLSVRDRLTRNALSRLDGMVDAGKLADIWTACLDTARHPGPGKWLHGDLHGGNLIVRNGALVGVIDYGLIGVGDPAVDLIPAWSFLEEANRDTFRDAAGAGPDEWRRGQGWTLSTAAIALDYYRDANPALSGLSLRALRELEACA